MSHAGTTAAGFTLEAQVGDLAAVDGRLGRERVALLAAQHAGPAAIAFAARRPERVSHLILRCTYARGTDYFGESRSQAAHAALSQDWELFTETIADAALGWSDPTTARQLAAQLREHVTPDLIAAFDATARTIDVADVLPEVHVPTLVLHRRQLRHPALAISSGLAARLPEARLSVLEGNAAAPFAGDAASTLHAIDEFLWPDGAGAAHGPPSSEWTCRAAERA